MKECKDCRDRHPARQDSCERFLAARKKKQERDKKIRAAKNADDLATNTVIRLGEARRRKYAK